MFTSPNVVMFLNSLKVIVNDEEPERELAVGLSLSVLTRELAQQIPGPLAFHCFGDAFPDGHENMPRGEIGAKWWPFNLPLPRYQLGFKMSADVKGGKVVKEVELSDVKVKKPPKGKYLTLDCTATFEFPDNDVAVWLFHQVGRHAACTFQEEQLSLLDGSQVSKATGELIEPPVASEGQPTIDTVLTSSEVVT